MAFPREQGRECRLVRRAQGGLEASQPLADGGMCLAGGCLQNGGSDVVHVLGLCAGFSLTMNEWLNQNDARSASDATPPL